MAESSFSPIADFFKDRSILITGATGFMGKVLVEKLLRSCSQTKTIYLIMRPKKGQEPMQRLEELFKTKVFDRVKEEQPECFSKVVPICGDLALPGMDISENDRSLLIYNVSIVFHSAATIKFNEPLKHYVDMNLMGTQRLVELCHKMIHLEALIHVSTAYSHCYREHIDEVLYESERPQNIIDIVQWMDEGMLSVLSPRLLKGFPNTYVYTKALAETLLAEESEGLPVAIVRPAIVTATWKEPFPGWIDNFNGPTGLIVAGSKGLLHSVYCKKSNIIEFIPVDVVINLMITVAWYTAIHRPSRILVYNCCSGNINPITWDVFERVANPIIQNYPSSDVIFYPTIRFTDSRLWHHLCVLLHQLFPAYVVDLSAWISGRKPR